MKSLNVFAAVGEALHFSARRLWTAFRLGWAPMAGMWLILGAGLFAANSVGGFGVSAIPVGDLLQLRSDSYDQTAGEALVGAGLVGGAVFLALIFYGAYITPLFRLAALKEDPPRSFFNWRLVGTRQVRFALGAVLSLGIGLIVFWGPLMILTADLVFLLSEMVVVFPDPVGLHSSKLADAAPSSWVSQASGAFALLVLGYLALRFSVYLPSVAMRDRLGLGAAWAASRGAVLKLGLGYLLLFAAMTAAHLAIVFGVGLVFSTIDLLAALFINISAFWTEDGAPSYRLEWGIYWAVVALNVLILTFYLFFWSAALSAFPAIAYRRLTTAQ